MEPIGPPSFDRLTPGQAKVLHDLMTRMIQAKFSRAELNTLVEVKNAVASIASVCKNDNELAGFIDFIEQMVRWYRLLGLWLSFYLQLYTQKGGNWVNHVRACVMHSDAQLSLNFDLAFDSTEVAYDTVLKTKKVLEKVSDSEQEMQALLQVEKILITRLRFFHLFYSHWCNPINPADFNPITDNLYYFRTDKTLKSAFPELDFVNKEKAIPSLLAVIEQCDSSDNIFYRIVARRFLAHQYQAKRLYEAAIEQLTAGLEEIYKFDLEAEAGHFHRLLAWVCLRKGDLKKAALHFDEAYKIDAPSPASYWRCLSARELGHIAERAAIFEVKLPKLSVDSDDSWKISSAFYRSGRFLFDAHIIDSSELPISMAIKQQMFRCYTENAIEEAMATQNPQDVVEEFETNSPHGISQIVAEMLAVQDLPADSVDEMRKNREVFHRHLTTIPEKFDDYIATFQEHYKSRHAYLKRLMTLSSRAQFSQTSNVTVYRILQMRLPSTNFLLFNTGRMSNYAIINMANSDIKCGRWPVPEQYLAKIHQEYVSQMNKTALEHDPMKQEQLRKQAVDFLLAEYEKYLSPTIEPLIPQIEKGNLKIFPRLQMNAVPLHALKVGDRRLIEMCDVSYNQNLNLFLNLHKEGTEKPPNPPLIVFNQAGTWGFFPATIKEIEQFHKAKLTVLQNPSWANILDGIKDSSAVDIFFACHGIYDPHKPALSHLELSNIESVAFTNIFADLDLSRYRSVVLGACESGIAKAELASEYPGLPTAFLAAGVRYFIGSLWEVSEFSTSILLSKYFKLLSSGNRTPPQALSEAQRQLMHMSRDAVWAWVKKNLPHRADDLRSDIEGLEKTPFTHPYFWAAFYVSGDI